MFLERAKIFFIYFIYDGRQKEENDKTNAKKRTSKQTAKQMKDINSFKVLK